jgi:hypothetical protein
MRGEKQSSWKSAVDPRALCRTPVNGPGTRSALVVCHLCSLLSASARAPPLAFARLLILALNKREIHLLLLYTHNSKL